MENIEICWIVVVWFQESAPTQRSDSVTVISESILLLILKFIRFVDFEA